jgi:hypothetical protein
MYFLLKNALLETSKHTYNLNLYTLDLLRRLLRKFRDLLEGLLFSKENDVLLNFFLKNL